MYCFCYRVGYILMFAELWMEVYLLSNEKCSKCDSENVDKGIIGGGFLGSKSHKQSIFSDPIRDFKA